MPQTWINALKQYNYPVSLADFEYAERFPVFFIKQIEGDRNSTILFEDYFRANIQHIETWYEVVFWKMYSQISRRDKRTIDIINQFKKPPVITANQLATALATFVNDPNERNFDVFRKMFRFNSKVIATVATFPAFLDPIRFPMIDTRVARWIDSQQNIFNENDPEGPQLIQSQYGQTKATVLTMTDFDFYLRWVYWTRHIAEKLSKVTNLEWRARDVEMAVFTAWGDRKCSHPRFLLNPI